MRFQQTPLATAAAWLLLASSSASLTAWTTGAQTAIAEAAESVAPPDLARRIDRHRFAYRDGIRQGASRAVLGKPISEIIEEEARRAIDMIRSHQPFESIVGQLGRLAYWVAYANNPFHTGARSAHYSDYLLYLDSARVRFRPVFYGLLPELEGGGDLAALVERATLRGRRYRPLLESEYRRVGGPPGRRKFDDRSTAFGVSAVAYSHAVTDVGLALRHVWIEAGGADHRQLPTRTPHPSPTHDISKDRPQ